MSWLEVPVVILNAFSARMDAIQAREALHTVNVIGVGTGSMKSDSSRSIIRDWELESGIKSLRRRQTRRRAQVAKEKGIVPHIPGLRR